MIRTDFPLYCLHYLTVIFVSVSAVGIAKITENGESENRGVNRDKPAEAEQQVGFLALSGRG